LSAKPRKSRRKRLAITRESIRVGARR
jgi:hypothetical protein